MDEQPDRDPQACPLPEESRRGFLRTCSLAAPLLLLALRSQAVAAARQGWLEYRAAGRVTELSFRYLLREEGVPSDHE